MHGQIAALTGPPRNRNRRRALGFAASVLVAFLAGFLGAGGGRLFGHGGVRPAAVGPVLSSSGPVLLPGAPSLVPAPAKPPDPRTPADRLRAMLAPLGTPAALEPATLTAWKKATRDPDPTLRAVARALLRASGTPVDAGPRVPPNSALIDLDVEGGLPGGDDGPVPEPSPPTDHAAPGPPDAAPHAPRHAHPRQTPSPRRAPPPDEGPP